MGKKNKFPVLEYFHHNEFDSPDIKNSGLLMDNDFVLLLNEARKMANIPFIINSGYRSKHHNSLVGGKSDSSHLKGLAVDIKCTNSRDRYIILHSLIYCGFHRIGINKSFIHVDMDERKIIMLVGYISLIAIFVSQRNAGMQRL